MCFGKFIVVILICGVSNAFSNIGDSLVKFSDLNFRTDFEKQTFRKYQISVASSDIIDLFLNSYTNTEGYNSTKAHEQINDCISVLKKETAGCTQEKAVKEIYKYVHKRFFKVYNLQNSFSDVFERGEYNCVSGSSMYAIIFQLMGIPYQIIEAPKHVFLIAYPQTHKIFIETTMPVNGYFTFDATYVHKYINYMRDSKMISQEEYSASNVNDLFNKYYFLQKGLTIQELAGIQYSNYAVYYCQKSEYEKASLEMKKAYYLAPNERHKYMLVDVLKATVSNEDYKDGKNVDNLIILCRYNKINDKEVTNASIKSEFTRLLHTQLISQSDNSLFERSYNSIKPVISDTVLRKEISFLFHYELARLGFNNFKDVEYQMEHLSQAYYANSKDMDLRQLIMASLARQVEINSSVSNIMNLLKEYDGKFGFLKEHAAFNSVKGNCLLELAYQHLMMNEISKGESYIAEFESLCSKDKDIKASDRFVERAYSTAATYYFKKGNKVKTKQLLKKGIEYAPENFGLKIRLNQLN